MVILLEVAIGWLKVTKTNTVFDIDYIIAFILSEWVKFIINIYSSVSLT